MSIIGCIDGSHIKIVAPKNNRNSYVNRKNFHSVLLQGVCDHKMLFTDVYTGEVGSLHDYTLYRRSELYLAIQTQQIRFFDGTHLVGDLAYKLHTNLMVGFKDNGHLTLRQKNFNVILSKIRVKIENAFALLKGRFRRLKFLETIRLELAALLIISACILHVSILNGDLLQDLIDVDEERRQEKRK
ncbi:hypothetical protein NQ314_006781 [Rhamnusium bicolor]|uniref:DDE Tnp4 domain-containing protein n=1 Tax=Rhamnusium bicolor TaxID=1586634 RepID=A0AAV8YV68_9CUCU|nr:hypothetical protein NQ314_006781 [Rhamnusium bicolor]